MSLVASFSTMNLDVDVGTNDNPDPSSHYGKQAQVNVEEVTIKKKKSYIAGWRRTEGIPVWGYYVETESATLHCKHQ